MADMNRKAATARPMGSSNSVSVLVEMVLDISSKYRKLLLIGRATELLIRTINEPCRKWNSPIRALNRRSLE
ncbi:MAG: hypothetical protein A4E29_01469 [Methanomassiliicoccales archaeon PtaB.Bin134]|nr:MAG: hypothetical protein A4E29_01469 [Methanomassiliicoccales archaeon PtaB.Bin134]